MESTKRRRGYGFSRLGFGVALVLLVLPMVAQSDSGGWLLNEEDGSEAQVAEVLAGADEMLQPAEVEALQGVSEPYVGPKVVPQMLFGATCRV